MCEGLTVDVPLKEANLLPGLAWPRLSLREDSPFSVAQLEREAEDLLKSPMIDTVRPASLSVAAHLSAVWRTYSLGRRGLLVLSR